MIILQECTWGDLPLALETEIDPEIEIAGGNRYEIWIDRQIDMKYGQTDRQTIYMKYGQTDIQYSYCLVNMINIERQPI